MLKIIVPPDMRGERIDVYLSRITGKTRSQVKQHIEASLVMVDGVRVRAGQRVSPGQGITYEEPEPESGELIPEDLPVEVLYRDEHIVVVAKPASMVVYPAAGHARGTLMNALKHICAGRLAGVGGPLRPGVVHRLDRDTSGVMVVALSEEAYYSLVEQFRDRTVDREYVALVLGRMPAGHGEVDAPIGRSRADRKRMSTRTRRGKEARTGWVVREEFGGASLIALRLGTGRTHQIRVHMAAMGRPVLGDREYGGRTQLMVGARRVMFPRQMLHAGRLGFTHPVTGRRMVFEAPPPRDFMEALDTLAGRGHGAAMGGGSAPEGGETAQAGRGV